VIEPKHLDDYRDDLAVYLIDYQVTLPGARRALAESEWLPQAGSAENRPEHHAKNRAQAPMFSSGG
jgi:hypothetical protein